MFLALGIVTTEDEKNNNHVVMQQLTLVLLPGGFVCDRQSLQGAPPNNL